MQTYISILRCINVSGHNLIRMENLREIYESLGFVNPRTYIQSGNVIFESKPADPGALENSISGGIMKTFGFEVPVILLDKEELQQVSERNAFISERMADVQKLHVTFLSALPEVNLEKTILREEYLPDEFYIQGKSVYLFCPNGYGNTKLSNTFFEKKLKVRATTRNWKTILELVKLSDHT